MLLLNQNLKHERFRIVNLIGRDKQDVVYEAFDNKLKINVLLKEISEEFSNPADASQINSQNLAFAEKAKIFDDIKHESLLQIHEYFSELDHHYLVMEKSDGETFDEVIRRKNSPVSLNDLKNWSVQILDALNYLHTKNPPTFHGGIKPQNIQINSNGKAKLFIHSIMQNSAADTNGQFDTTNLAFLPLGQIWQDLDTASQKFIFNAFDEHAQKNLELPADAQSDIYSVGATLYFLATARLPLDALTRLIDVIEGKVDPLPPPNKINPKIPQKVSDILMKALEIKRENRFDSALIINRALRHAFAAAEQQKVLTAEFQEETNVLEIPFVEPKSQIQKQSIQEIETAKNQQIEIIKGQLQKAEERRLDAEKRAAAAEKLLQEKRNSISDADENSIKETKSEVIIESKTVSTPITANKNAPENLFRDYANDSDEPVKNKKLFLKVAAGAFMLLLIGGSAWGIYNFTDLFSTSETQVISPETVAPPETAPLPISIEVESNEKTESGIYGSNNEVENQTFDETSPVTETISADPKSSENTKKPLNRSSAKTNNSTVKPKEINNQPPPTPKPIQAKKKKDLTIDDLLKDN